MPCRDQQSAENLRKRITRSATVIKKREFDHFGGHLGALYPSPLTDHHQLLMRCCFRPEQHSCQNSSRWVHPFLHNARASRQRTDRRRADRRQNCFGIGRDLYGRPRNRPITDKVIVRNPGCTLLSNTVIFFGMATHFWPLTVCLSRLVVCWCTRQPWTYRCVFRWHMKQPFKWAHVEVSFMVLHRESKKQDTKLLAITSPTIIRFSNFFH